MGYRHTDCMAFPELQDGGTSPELIAGDGPGRAVVSAGWAPDGDSVAATRGGDHFDTRLTSEVAVDIVETGTTPYPWVTVRDPCRGKST